MDGDYSTGGYDQDGGRRRKRSFDDASGDRGGSRQDHYDPRYNNNNSHGGGGYGDDTNNNNGGGGGGYHKRARYDDRSSNYRPRDNYRRDDDRYNNNSNSSSYGGRGRYNNDRGGRFDRYSSGGGANGESDRARAWRLMKKAIVELGEATQLGDDVQGSSATRDHMHAAAAKVLSELEVSDEESKLKHISALTLRCVSKLAHKTSLYAVLVGLVNEKKPAFGRKIVDATLASLQRDLAFFARDADVLESDDDDALRKAGDVPAIALRVRLHVRFLGELVSTRVLKSDDLVSVLDTLQSVCTPEDFTVERDESLRAREDAAAFKDFFASVVLDTLLHVRRCRVSLAAVAAS